MCKQCVGKVTKTPLIDDLDRPDQLTELLGFRGIMWAPEISNSDMAAMQTDDDIIGPVTDSLKQDLHHMVDELRAQPLAARNLWAQHTELTSQDGVLLSSYTVTKIFCHNSSPPDHTKKSIRSHPHRTAFGSSWY